MFQYSNIPIRLRLLRSGLFELSTGHLNLNIINDIKTNFSADFLIYWLICGTFLSVPLGTSPPLICGGLAALVWIVSGKPIKRWRVYAGQRWFWPVAVLFLLPWIGLLYTPDPSGFGRPFATKTYYWVFGFVVAAIPFARFSAERLIQAFCIGLAVNAVVAVLQFAGIVPIINPFAYGLALGSSTMAAFLNLGILMASRYFRDTNDRRKRLFYALLGGLFFFHLIIMRGRTGLFTFFVVSPLILRNVFGRIKILRMVLIYEILVGVMLLSPVVWDRIFWSVDQLKHHLSMDPHSAWGKEWDNQEDRLFMWRGAIQIFLEHPVLGVGTGGYPVVMYERGDPDWPYMYHPHSNYLYMAASFGLIGVFALTWFFWEMFKNAWEERQTHLGYFIFSTALVMFISGIFNTQIIDSSTALLLALAVGLQNGLPKFSRAITPHVSKAQIAQPETQEDMT